MQHIYEGNILFTKVKYHNDVVFDQNLSKKVILACNELHSMTGQYTDICITCIVARLQSNCTNTTDSPNLI